DGKIAPKAFSQNAVTTIEFPEAGDYERDQPFSVAAWVRFEKINQVGSMVSRMDISQKARGWDFCFEQGQLTMAIVSAFPEKFFKAVADKPVEPNTWYHIAMSYDGSSKASGVKIFINGVAQTVTEAEISMGRDLDDTAKSTVPLRVGE